MGSGPKFSITSHYQGFALGFSISRFPHTVSVNLMLGFWHIYIGFGKGYDEQ